jgi:hypothetical protein
MSASQGDVATQALQVVGTGIFSGIGLFLGNYFWHRYNAPNLEIENVTCVENPEYGTSTAYVKVRNKGRTAARDCKAFVLYEDYDNPLAWLQQRTTSTINAYDYDYVIPFTANWETNDAALALMPSGLTTQGQLSLPKMRR